MCLGLKFLCEELGWPSMTARRITRGSSSKWGIVPVEQILASSIVILWKEIEPSQISRTYFSATASAFADDTICPTSPACVGYYTAICTRSRQPPHEHAAALVGRANDERDRLKICAASSASWEKTSCTSTSSSALCVARRFASRESPMPATWVKCGAKLQLILLEDRIREINELVTDDSATFSTPNREVGNVVVVKEEFARLEGRVYDVGIGCREDLTDMVLEVIGELLFSVHAKGMVVIYREVLSMKNSESQVVAEAAAAFAMNNTRRVLHRRRTIVHPKYQNIGPYAPAICKYERCSRTLESIIESGSRREVSWILLGVRAWGLVAQTSGTYPSPVYRWFENQSDWQVMSFSVESEYVERRSSRKVSNTHDEPDLQYWTGQSRVLAPNLTLILDGKNNRWGTQAKRQKAKHRTEIYVNGSWQSFGGAGISTRRKSDGKMFKEVWLTVSCSTLRRLGTIWVLLEYSFNSLPDVVPARLLCNSLSMLYYPTGNNMSCVPLSRITTHRASRGASTIRVAPSPTEPSSLSVLPMGTERISDRIFASNPQLAIARSHYPALPNLFYRSALPGVSSAY
ncbi:hypothetical protein EDB87DRAFT_1582537 [Lactarius vividus]|nr:hypothetical protein EDB87DRAFT_1582537 [Lactarius vividus]